AQISPTWFTRIKPAAWRASSAVISDTSLPAGFGRDARAERPNTSRARFVSLRIWSKKLLRRYRRVSLLETVWLMRTPAKQNGWVLLPQKGDHCLALRQEPKQWQHTSHDNQAYAGNLLVRLQIEITEPNRIVVIQQTNNGHHPTEVTKEEQTKHQMGAAPGLHEQHAHQDQTDIFGSSHGRRYQHIVQCFGNHPVSRRKADHDQARQTILIQGVIRA